MKSAIVLSGQVRKSEIIIWKIFFKIIGLAENLILSITVIWKIFRKIIIIATIKFTLEPMADTLLSSPAFEIKATQDALKS